jgi:hypothetical protein
MRRSWFDEANTLSFQRYYQQMATWQRAIADGQIEAAEVEAQAQRVADRLRALEPTLTDEQHEQVTDVLHELSVLQAMQAWLARSPERLDRWNYSCPNANLAELSERIADRFRRDGFEVTVTSEGSDRVIRTKKSDGWRMAFGLVYDVSIRLTPTPGGFHAKLDWGEWTDKIISGALTVVGLWPWLVTGSVGLYNEYELTRDAERIIEDYVAECSARPPAPSASP